MARIVYVITASWTGTRLLPGQLAYMRELGHEVHLIAGDEQHLAAIQAAEGVTVHCVPMARDMAPRSDWHSLGALTAKLRELRPDLVNASTPKAGLLGMMAANKAGVRARVYVLRGLRLETAAGWKGAVLERAERKTCSLASKVVCVSHGLRKEAEKRHLLGAGKGLVIGAGSSNGVIVERFVQTPEREAAASQMAQALGLPERRITVGFVGRFTRDKGINELVQAFRMAQAQAPSLNLLLAGDYEDGDPVHEETRAEIERGNGIWRTGFLKDTAPAYLLMDALCLPTYREGFPNVPIEAAAAGRPTIATDATGCADAVVDGKTGWIVPVRDPEALCRAFLHLAANPEAAAAMGAAAKARALAEFPPERIWAGLASLYDSLLNPA